MRLYNYIARGMQNLNHIFHDLDFEMYYNPATNILTLAKVQLNGNELAEFNLR